MSESIATVGYVRSPHIGSLSVLCEGKRESGDRCNHQTDIDLAPYPDELPCSAIERRLFCKQCGAIGAVDALPELGGDARSLFVSVAKLAGQRRNWRGGCADLLSSAQQLRT